MEQLNKEFVFSHIPPRAPESHKGSYGRLLVVAGSRRYRGAAGLAAEGALRSGAGIVTLASVEPVIGAAASRLPECCLLPCPEGEEGGIAAAGLEMLQAAAAHATVLLLGPGLGHTGDTRALVQGLPAQMRGTVVLDADGLNAAADLLARGGAMPLPASGSLIVTPHPGEMARLTGLPAERIAADRPGVASRFAAQWGVHGGAERAPHLHRRPRWPPVAEHHRQPGPGAGRQRGCAGGDDRRPGGLWSGRPCGSRLRSLAARRRRRPHRRTPGTVRYAAP